MTAPTWADHQRDARRYPACNCGAVWHQRGNITGHCTRCHQTFDGISLFDRHQSTDAHGRTHCRAGSEIRLGKAETPLELHDGVWRGPRMTEETIAARFGARLAPEWRPARRQSDENLTDGKYLTDTGSDAS